ncbi:MAG: iron-containing alcohol dehydrogenase, partial [Candidatus Cloacimonetes bacterium]|nr:iron-containing alcohol dehydrogenase [Candidatus Cloacimonadota bacterium]
NHFPILAIPTTSGTGSEITQYSVITNRETSIKAGFGSEKCFPKVSFLDPKYTLSLNARVTRDTAIDALSHLLEGLYSNKYNEFLLPFIHTGVKLIYDNLSLCLKDLSCIKYRHNLMLAANYGGIVIAHTSTTLQHSIGYPLTTVFGVSHGLANGLVMRQIMNLYEPHIKDRTDRLFVKLNITKDAFFKWLDSFEMVFEGKIDEVFLKNRVPEVLKSRNMTLSPCVVNEQEITNIYKTL